ncbi:MAG: phosphatidylglycerol lysyltransferase domain-containing protein [Mariniblastus sp.]
MTSPIENVGRSNRSDRPMENRADNAKPRRKKRRGEVSQTYWAQEQELDEVDTGLSLDTRMSLLSQYGDFTLAYSTAVQPRLMHFGDDRGYIAYRKRLGLTFVLGDCVAPDSRSGLLLDEFLKQHRRVSFCQVGPRTAKLLADRGYFLNEMGVDTTLDLQQYDFKGKEKEWLRYAANWTNRRGYKVVESSFSEISPERVEAISEAWRKTRTVKRKEVRFLNRPIVLRDEPDVRKFFLLSPEKEVLAFAFLDPLYRDGENVGFVTAFKRRHPDSPQYAEQAIMKFAIEKLKQEGVAELKLGLSPLARITDEEFKSGVMTRWLFQTGYNARWVNRYFYNVVGHDEYKLRFRGDEEKAYFACSSRFSIPSLFALIGLCGIA